ncbi:MAG: pyridoxamine 5'-phosphate oxidase family protein [Cyclobacteriaceae bacterium]|nr:pyridoxamine 5'-phosphate oxidase family protein [Cyclobacteriaceae bacterium HetDA_MAG_MS6]
MKNPVSKVVRGSKRAVYTKDEVYQIIDAHSICHIPYLHEGIAITIPTGYGRLADTLYLHGAISNRMLNGLLDQAKVSATITHLDGLVLARSVFHHSFNYRSAVVFGTARLVDDPEEKMEALKVITENIIPGRWEEARLPNPVEMKRTLVLAIDIEEVSAKVRAEGVNDDEEDLTLTVWAGVLPLKLIKQTPIPEPNLAPGTEMSKAVLAYEP